MWCHVRKTGNCSQVEMPKKEKKYALRLSKNAKSQSCGLAPAQQIQPTVHFPWKLFVRTSRIKPSESFLKASSIPADRSMKQSLYKKLIAADLSIDLATDILSASSLDLQAHWISHLIAEVKCFSTRMQTDIESKDSRYNKDNCYCKKQLQ